MGNRRVKRYYRPLAIDLNGIIPAKKNYYADTGSLTTEPFSEAGQWIVMENPIQASAKQILNKRATQENKDNHDRYVRYRNSLEKKMTSSQVAEAQKLAHEWKPNL